MFLKQTIRQGGRLCHAEARVAISGIPWHVVQRGNNLQIGRTAYGDLFRAHLEPERVQEIRKATNGNYALGKERFRRKSSTLRRRATPGKSGRPVRPRE